MFLLDFNFRFDDAIVIQKLSSVIFMIINVIAGLVVLIVSGYVCVRTVRHGRADAERQNQMASRFGMSQVNPTTYIVLVVSGAGVVFLIALYAIWTILLPDYPILEPVNSHGSNSIFSIPWIGILIVTSINTIQYFIFMKSARATHQTSVILFRSFVSLTILIIGALC